VSSIRVCSFFFVFTQNLGKQINNHESDLSVDFCSWKYLKLVLMIIWIWVVSLNSTQYLDSRKMFHYFQLKIKIQNSLICWVQSGDRNCVPSTYLFFMMIIRFYFMWIPAVIFFAFFCAVINSFTIVVQWNSRTFLVYRIFSIFRCFFEFGSIEPA